MDTKIRKILLELLEKDPEVINAVKKAVNSENIISANKESQAMESLRQIKQLKEEIIYITQQKNSLIDELNRKNEELTNKERDLTTLKEAVDKDLKQKDEEISSIQLLYMECKNKKDEAIEKYNDFKLKYSELDAIYNKYLELGEPIIKRMERILNNSSDITETPEVFMAYGTQENNIVALWESIATNFDLYDSYGKTGDLIDIFRYFIELYKEITFKNIQIDWPDIGDMYDERKHTRTSSSSAVGKIQKVILPGFSIGKNITKKSLVIVN